MKKKVKKKKKKNAVSNDWLSKKWRKTVLSQWGHKCARCGSTENLQCHHIVYIRNKLLKWDWRNGIVGCMKCHQFYHSKLGEIFISEKSPHYSELVQKENIVFKQYLIDEGITENEFRLNILQDLKDNELQKLP